MGCKIGATGRQPEDAFAEQDCCEEAEGLQQAHGDADVEAAEGAIASPPCDSVREDLTARLPKSFQPQPLD